MRTKKYRVVTDDYLGFEAQVWRIWFPFWVKMSEDDLRINTHLSLESAVAFIKRKKAKVKLTRVVWTDAAITSPI